MDEKLNHVEQHDPNAWKRAPSVQIAEERAKAEKERLRDIQFEKKCILKALHSMDIKEGKKMYVQMKETDARNDVKMKETDAQNFAQNKQAEVSGAASSLESELHAVVQSGLSDISHSYNQGDGWSKAAAQLEVGNDYSPE